MASTPPRCRARSARRNAVAEHALRREDVDFLLSCPRSVQSSAAPGVAAPALEAQRIAQRRAGILPCGTGRAAAARARPAARRPRRSPGCASPTSRSRRRRRLEPFLHLVGDLLGRAAEHRAVVEPCRGPRPRQSRAPTDSSCRLADHPVAQALPGQRGELLVGKGLVVAPTWRSRRSALRTAAPSIDRLGQSTPSARAAPRPAPAVSATTTFTAGAILNIDRVAARLLDLVLEVGVVLAADLEDRIGGEDQLGPARREGHAAAALAGLQQHRMALRRARHGERALGLEELAAMVEAVDLVGVGEAAGLACR